MISKDFTLSGWSAKEQYQEPLRPLSWSRSYCTTSCLLERGLQRALNSCEGDPPQKQHLEQTIHTVVEQSHLQTRSTTGDGSAQGVAQSSMERPVWILKGKLLRMEGQTPWAAVSPFHGVSQRVIHRHLGTRRPVQGAWEVKTILIILKHYLLSAACGH